MDINKSIPNSPKRIQCPHCGGFHPEGAIFCPKVGLAITNESLSTERVQPSKPPPLPVPPTSVPPPVPVKSLTKDTTLIGSSKNIDDRLVEVSLIGNTFRMPRICVACGQPLYGSKETIDKAHANLTGYKKYEIFSLRFPICDQCQTIQERYNRSFWRTKQIQEAYDVLVDSVSITTHDAFTVTFRFKGVAYGRLFKTLNK